MDPEKILLFSSDMPLANAIRAALAEAGYRVISRAEGLDAVDIIQNEKPSLVVLDIRLEGMNSLAIIHMMRTSYNESRIPVILTGAALREEDILFGLEVGADLCLAEVFHPQVFIARVRSLIRRRQASQASFRLTSPG